MPVMGISFGEYKTFDETRRKELKDALLRKALASYQPDYQSDGDDDFDGVVDAFQLMQFERWRKYGVPDRPIEDWEVDEIVFSRIAEKVRDDPDFGKLPETYEQYSDDDKRRIGCLVYYFDEMRDPHEYLALDLYSLDETLGYSDEDVAWLVKEGVLVDLGTERWMLSEVYTNAYLVRELRRREKELDAENKNS